MRSLSDWRIERGEALSGGQTESREVVRWQDTATPLTIAEVPTGAGVAYRLRMDSELAVDAAIDGPIIVRASPTVPQATIDHFLADQVIPRLLAHSGSFVFHAGAVQLGHAALVFMGRSGRGKSTLVTSFDRAGLGLLGDDAMVLSTLDGVPHVRPVYPSLRLFPDSIEALMPGAATAGPVAHYSDKERIDVEVAGDAGHSPLPVQALFSIAPPSEGTDICIRPLSIADACIMLVESSFSLDPADLALAKNRLREATALATAVPAFEISYPRDFDRLPDVRAAIIYQVQDRLQCKA